MVSGLEGGREGGRVRFSVLVMPSPSGWEAVMWWASQGAPQGYVIGRGGKEGNTWKEAPIGKEGRKEGRLPRKHQACHSSVCYHIIDQRQRRSKHPGE